MRTPWASLGALWLAGCAGSTPQLEGLDREKLPNAEDFETDTYTIEDHTVVTFRPGADGPEAVVRRRHRLVILRNEARDAADSGWSHSRAFSDIVDARVTVLRPDGESMSFDSSDMQDHPLAAARRYYNDIRVVSLDAPEYPVGTVIDKEVVKVERRPDLFAYRHHFGGPAPVGLSRFEVRLPTNWTVHHRGARAWKPFEWAPERRVQDEHTVLIWERENVEAIPREDQGPGISDLAPLVAVRLAEWQWDGELQHAPRSLEEYSRWIVDLQEGTAEPTPEIEAKVREILAEVPDDPFSRARALHDWVKEHIRYVAIEIGLGGWRPYSAEQVFGWGYGDCKDKATLLKAMLHVAGIDSYMVTLFSHRGVPRDFILPSIGFTNHAILAIDLPDGMVVVDPTERTVPFGELPPRDQEAKLLINHPSEPRIWESPPSSHEANRRTLDLRLEQDSEDAMKWKGNVDLEARGALGAWLQRSLSGASGSERGQVIARWSRLPEWNFTDFDHEAGYDEHGWSVRTNLEFELPQAGSRSGSTMLLRASDLMKTTIRRRSESDRATPLVFRIRRTEERRIRLSLASGNRVRSLPEPVSVETQFGRYDLQWTAPQEGTVELRQHFELTERIIEPEQFEAFRRFVDRVLRADRAAAVLEVVSE